MEYIKVPKLQNVKHCLKVYSSLAQPRHLLIVASECAYWWMNVVWAQIRAGTLPRKPQPNTAGSISLGVPWRTQKPGTRFITPLHQPTLQTSLVTRTSSLITMPTISQYPATKDQTILGKGVQITGHKTPGWRTGLGVYFWGVYYDVCWEQWPSGC